MELGQLAAGLASNPTAWMLALALLAVAYLFKELSAERKDKLTMVVNQEAAHRETLMKVIPLTEKLMDALALVERLSNAFTPKG